MSDDDSLELGPSELGTKEYWTEVYEQDQKNFKNHGDVGEIWFGEDSEFRVIRYLSKQETPADKKIVDLGCGNGMMLVELAREGFSNLTGVDYCESAIELAKSVVEGQSMDIKLQVADLTTECDIGTFDIVLDKGTFDAISLSPEDAPTKKQNYIKNVNSMLVDNGIFIITSCNWTESELIQQISPVLKHKEKIPSPTFRFGGKSGNVVSAVVFEKQ